MNSYKRLVNIAGWLVFAIATIVYFLSVERTGSLWDCGEFIAGAYKLQVVHPPGAPLFLLVGRMFTLFAELFSNNLSDIAFAVNMLSGICTAFTATFVCWTTIILGKMALIGRQEEPDSSQTLVLAGAGVVAGLSTAFATSIWFSAVEGEVYAMSTMFTAMTLWSMMKWYNLPDTPQADRWVVFTIYAAGLSVGVHLLSLLTFPALAMFYYFKKNKERTFKGMAIAAAVGVVGIVVIQKLVIVGIPELWAKFELLMVNSLGMPFHSGLFPTILLVAAILVIPLLYIHQKIESKIPIYVLAGLLIFIVFFLHDGVSGNQIARKLIAALLIGGAAYSIKWFTSYPGEAQLILVSIALVVISFSTIGVVVIRANANTPINMNEPSDAMRLLPYLNREQYGERPLLRGPHYQTRIERTNVEDRYGRLGDRYEIVDHKAEHVFDKGDQMLFPRLGHLDEARKPLYEMWLGHKRKPTMGDNIKFFFQYQIGWMYWRYFMWNFSGRQNGEQGFYSWDKTSGNWLSGIPFIDNMRLGNQSQLPEMNRTDQSRNRYFMLPFLFGLLGMYFHYKRRPKDFLGLLTLFIITGVGIIVYSNQPPNEPRERDYVLAGSIFTYAIWIGMAVLALFELLKQRAGQSAKMAAPIAFAVILIAPLLMGFQNFDDHSRRHHSASRDYASNFLNSCEPNAIIFTYGDNDTYPLWYAQEVENIRTDVRVVNLSLIAVDWYIDQLRRKVNDSPPIKMSLSSESLRGFKRIQIPIDPYGHSKGKGPQDIYSALKFLEEDHPLQTQGGRPLDSYFPTKSLMIPINRAKARQMGMINASDSTLTNAMVFNLNKGSYMLKGDAAVLDIVASNIWERPIYFAVTCRQESLMGLQDYTQLEGLALRIVPKKSNGDPVYGMIGNGRVNVDKFYSNFMNKFRWGNFDKASLYVDRSYGPTIQTSRFGVLRVVTEMTNRGDNERAVQLLDKYFEAFPHMNFPYDANTILFINMYLKANALDKAKQHMRILAEYTADKLAFFNSLSEDTIEAGYSGEASNSLRAKMDLQRIAKDVIKEPEFEQELKNILGE